MLLLLDAGDDDALLLYYMTERENALGQHAKVTSIDGRARFSFNNLSTRHGISALDFCRFTEDEVDSLSNNLLPEEWKCNKVCISRKEALTIVLRRFAYPNRWVDLITYFHRSAGELCTIFTDTIMKLSEHADRVLDFKCDRIRPILHELAQVTVNSGSPFPCIIGFIDGTGREVCRPTVGQEAIFSGHHRDHELKYQSIILPTGLGFLYGPEAGRHHDMYLFQDSIEDELAFNLHDDQGNFYALFGDQGYCRRPGLQCPVKKVRLREDEAALNASMSTLRQVVEWIFGCVLAQFRFLDFPLTQRILMSPVAAWYRVAYFLYMCQGCMRGQNQVSLYYDTVMPTLQQYLQIDIIPLQSIYR